MQSPRIRDLCIWYWVLPNTDCRDHGFADFALRSQVGTKIFLLADERGERGEDVCAKQKFGVGLCGDLLAGTNSNNEQNLLEKERQKAPKMDEQVVDDDGDEEQPGRCQENPYAHVQLAEAADVKDDDSAEHLLSLRSARDSIIPH